LISNDDGIRAEGIDCLAETLSEIASVTVVAPDRNRSGASSSLTLDVPLRVEEVAPGRFSVTGSPADCVHLGCYRLMPEPPDLVVAGINHGANLGDDVLYSGTVAAALEGRHLGMPALAVSLNARSGPHFATAARVVVDMIQRLRAHPLTGRRVLNINVPNVPPDELKGIRFTRLGSRHRKDTLITDKDPKGQTIYWLGPPSDGDDIGEGTDFWAVSQGYVSVTPIHVDLTDHEARRDLENWFLEQET
jgi:5'-nucleotidase